MIAATVWSLGLIIAAFALPVYNGESISDSSGVTFTSTTLVANQGAWVLIPTAVPLVVCGVVALALRRKRAAGDGRIAWLAVGLLGVFALISILSIGAVVLPTVLLLARAVMLTGANRAGAAPTGQGRAPQVRPG